MLHYLFKNFEPYYNDIYIFTDDEKRDRQVFYRHLRDKYKNSKQYIQRVGLVLFSNDDDLQYFEDTIQKKVFRKEK
jgi:hypothetical protein